MHEPTVALNQEQIDFFHENGYLVIEAITTAEEVAWLREVYDGMFDACCGREVGDQFDLAGTDEEGKAATLPQILNPEKYAPEFKSTMMRANAVAIGRQLVGAEAEAAGAHAIYKPPRTGAETPWHQDEAYWRPEFTYNSVSIWVPLQEATIENGCMWFAPGSHKLEVLRHRSIKNDPRIHGLELHPDERHHVRDAVACPLPSGGATIHANRTLHHTAPNRSEIPRRAYILNAGCKAARRQTPRRFPWLEEKRTARQERAAAAVAAGKLVQQQPTGDVSA